MCVQNLENPSAGIYRGRYEGRKQPASFSVTQPLSSSEFIICYLVGRNISFLGKDRVLLSPV